MRLLPSTLSVGACRRLQAYCSAAGATLTPQQECRKSPTAALLIIGSEILNGSIQDTNTPWLAKLLHSRGVPLARVEVVPDDVGVIQDSVLRLQEVVGPTGFVFTSGGIGPTHDDVTYEAIAATFGVRLEQHGPTVERLRKSCQERNLEVNASRLRMATLPSPCDEVLVTPGTWVPLVVLQGTYILPGIPRLFQSMLSAHQKRFSGTQILTRQLFTPVGEGDLAEPLRAVAGRHPDVAIGSYPITSAPARSPYRVRVALESTSAEALHAAAEDVLSLGLAFSDNAAT